VWVTGVSRLAGADSNVIGSQALSAGAASVVQRAGIHALSFDTSLGVDAIVGRLALELDALDGWISSGLGRAAAQSFVVLGGQTLGSFAAGKLSRITRTAAGVVDARGGERTV